MIICTKIWAVIKKIQKLKKTISCFEVNQFFLQGCFSVSVAAIFKLLIGSPFLSLAETDIPQHEKSTGPSTHCT